MSSIRLGEIGKISMCKRILKSQTNEFSGIPFYKISTFGGTPTVYIDEKIYREYKEKYSYPKKGDILISAAGTIGKTVIFDGEDSYFQDSNIVWIENDESKVTNQFLYYFLQTNPFITTNGSTIKRLYNDNLRDTKIPNVPSIQQQNQITDILGTLDQKIQINNQINQELEAMAKTLYDYWFVQFDFPDPNGKPYKSSGGKMVYHPDLKREIPEGWGVEKLSHFLTIKNGKDHKHLQDGKFAVYGSGGIMRTVADYLYSGESILFPRKGTLNNVMYVNEKFWTVDTMFYSEVNKNTSALYVFYSVKDIDFNKLNTGTGVPSMTSSILYDLNIIVPEENILEKFNTVVKRNYETIKLNNIQNQELTQLRDWLLPMLMNGQVKVE
ncbi:MULTISPECIES: restriction endonuclease subunit S [Streptococcus]|uniref:Putative type I restriction enzyme specificity protein n=1 Tax=Streptococcus oralis TaxID=1303 RepID=A0A428CHT6_STROR|nr:MULTISPECIES: restriction endonuclease subunit S [Streptococcus]MCY7133107.1 restriction endonuclease subunit S [Streptococcus gordonii]RSI77581.1 putative type I restriction enzyme specificity protein [Streptococcus oralis]RSJ46914.1 putative type I restriction enzyme specificity protein [Streptococcus gordonii]RSJ47635.1 putative type I restriction enzyme specificity protein [Streptococcus gordonii]RSJ50660.1 putative type I restriction enzyme specificity protein [Streptococcus gordonii]